MKKSFARFVLILPLVLMLCLAFGCQRKAEQAEVKEMVPVVNLEAEKAAVEKVLDQYNQVWITKDMEMLSRIMAHDSDMVNYGTDAAEKWVGWESLRDSSEKQFKSIDFAEILAKDQVIKIHKSGEVAWFSEIWDMKGKAQGEAFSQEGVRFTGVLEKRAGNWIIVQFHGSVPVAGQAVKY